MNWMVALPEIVLAALGMVILIFGVLNRRDPFKPVSMMALGALLIAAFLVVTRAGGAGYHGQFTVDSFAVLIKALIIVPAALMIIVSLDYNPHHAIARFEFPILVLFAVVGMMGMASATNLMVLYLALELQSIAQYVLAGIARDELRSSEAGLKYFVLGALASGLLLYGISLVYGFSGTMDFATLAHAFTLPGGVSPGVIVGVVFILVGLAFKVSAAPFHMWTPDVYEGAPTSVSLFFATAPKLAALALFLRTMVQPFGHMLDSWRLLIEIIAITSMLIGALGAIGQTSIKRLMAYSAISHVGYMLIGLAVGTQIGVQGALVYLLIYVFMTAGTWACIAAMRRRGRSLELISDLAGLGRTDPALALALSVFMFSLAGIPPLAGFFAKLYVFLAAVDAQMWALAVIGVLSSVLASYYYIHVVKVMYFDAPQQAFDRKPSGIIFVAAVTGLFTLFFFVFPAPFVGAAASAAASLFG